MGVAILPAGAVAEGSLAGQLLQCMGIFEAVGRLSCYDRVAHSANAQGAVAPQPVVPAAPSAPAASAPPILAVPRYAGSPLTAPQSQMRPEQFGSENLKTPAVPAGQPTRLNAISAAISAYSFTPKGRFILTLSNGQVWRQIEGDVSIPNFREKAARSVTISRGVLGSYNLTFSDQAGRFKVARVQ